jgi:hypothetical protein
MCTFSAIFAFYFIFQVLTKAENSFLAQPSVDMRILILSLTITAVVTEVPVLTNWLISILVADVLMMMCSILKIRFQSSLEFIFHDADHWTFRR